MTERLQEVDLSPDCAEYAQISDLALTRASGGRATVSRAVMERFCLGLGRSLDALPEGDIGATITALYLWHCAVAGGDAHPVIESLLAQGSSATSIGQPRCVLVREVARPSRCAAAASPDCGAPRAMLESARS